MILVDPRLLEHEGGNCFYKEFYPDRSRVDYRFCCQKKIELKLKDLTPRFQNMVEMWISLNLDLSAPNKKEPLSFTRLKMEPPNVVV